MRKGIILTVVLLVCNIGYGFSGDPINLLTKSNKRKGGSDWGIGFDIKGMGYIDRKFSFHKGFAINAYKNIKSDQRMRLGVFGYVPENYLGVVEQIEGWSDFTIYEVNISVADVFGGLEYWYEKAWGNDFDDNFTMFGYAGMQAIVYSSWLVDVANKEYYHEMAEKIGEKTTSFNVTAELGFGSNFKLGNQSHLNIKLGVGIPATGVDRSSASIEQAMPINAKTAIGYIYFF